MPEREPRSRLEHHLRTWRVDVESIRETAGALLAFGARGNHPVVLKVIKKPGGEWRGGEVLASFQGRGAARVYQHCAGAALMERLRPGASLADAFANGGDEQATHILADVILGMSTRPHPPMPGDHFAWPTAREWGAALNDFAASSRLAAEARRIYLQLCDSQSRPRLLHGDLHHHNVLFDSHRGWLAVDAKGVIGELEFETGAILRNPYQRPEIFTRRATIERRVRRLAAKLNLDQSRVLAWGFAQAVLAAAWCAEDGEADGFARSCLELAEVLRPMLGIPIAAP